MKKFMNCIVIAMMLVCILPSSGLALTNEEVFSQFQFNFLTPGARATALGGAFIGLADDATAVESNPAGLTQLYDSEVSIEFKYISYTTKQIFENLSFNTNITKREFDDSVESVPFASVAFPYKRFVFSLYRQELVNYESSFQTNQYPIINPVNGDSIFPIKASTDLIVTNYGIGIAVQPIEGVSLAVSPRWSEMEMNASSKRFNADPNDIVDFSVPTDFSDDDIWNATGIDDSDGDFSVNAGFLWRLQWLEEKFDIPRVSIGAVYRSGAKFEITETFITPVFLIFQETWEGVTDLTEFTLKVPDSFGVGVTVRPIDDLTLTLDVIHIQYEDLLEDFDIVISPGDRTKDDYTVDNATEVHFGVEYVLALGERLLALRAGVYNDPDHTVRYTGDDSTGKVFFPGGDDQFHVTGGVGLVVSERFQIDTAANIADNNRQLSLSAVYRF